MKVGGENENKLIDTRRAIYGYMMIVLHNLHQNTHTQTHTGVIRYNIDDQIEKKYLFNVLHTVKIKIKIISKSDIFFLFVTYIFFI